MNEDYPIHDLYIEPISPETFEAGTRWIALRHEDHLLRRFGQAEVVRTLPGHTSEKILHEAADEVWSLIEGEVEFVWHDLRQDSPTYDQRHSHRCDEPTLVLAPFGVEFGYSTFNSPALLLRLSTHSDSIRQRDRVESLEKDT